MLSYTRTRSDQAQTPAALELSLEFSCLSSPLTSLHFLLLMHNYSKSPSCSKKSTYSKLKTNRKGLGCTKHLRCRWPGTGRSKNFDLKSWGGGSLFLISLWSSLSVQVEEETAPRISAGHVSGGHKRTLVEWNESVIISVQKKHGPYKFTTKPLIPRHLSYCTKVFVFV